MNYTLHQLKILIEVARQKSVTKASEELHMTQPAVSIQLRNFQDQFDIPLFEVIGKRLFITDFGNSVVSIAQRIINEAENIRYMSTEFKGLYRGKLKISSVSTGKYVIPYFLNEFLSMHPGIDLELDVSNKKNVIDQLKNNQIDFALVSVPPEGISTDEVLLMDNELYLISNQPEINPNAPIIKRELGSATRTAMESYFKNTKAGVKSLQLTSNEAVKQAVIAGLGNSILPLIGIRNEINTKQLYIIPSKGLPIRTSWRLIWRKEKKLSPIARAYLEFVSENKKAIEKKYFGELKNPL
ncbi:MAG: LysR substrate-binding domain-containing protein [Flavobacteriaceae bacterium]